MPLIFKSGSVSSTTGLELSRYNRGRTDYLPFQDVQIDGSENLQYYVHYYDENKAYLSNSGMWLSGSFNVTEGAPSDAFYYRLVVKNVENTTISNDLVTCSYKTTATILGGVKASDTGLLTLNDLGYGSYKARMTNGTDYSDWCYWIVVDATATAVTTDRCQEVSVTFSASNAEPLFVKWAGGKDNGTKHISVLTDMQKALGSAVCKYDPGYINDKQGGMYKIRVAFQTEYGIIHTPLQEAITVDHTYNNACDADCNVCGITRVVKEHVYKNATCTSPKTCKVCGATIGEAKGHKYTNACDTSCNTCGAKRTIKHSYKDIITKATLSKSGKIENKCSVCGNVKSTKTIAYAKTFKLSATSYTYNGSVKKPTVTVKDSAGKTLKSGTDYTVTYASGRKSVGQYKVIVTFKGNYSGTKTLTFNILPSKTRKITATPATTTLKATWSKVTGASGYKVELLNSSGKVVKSATTTKLTYTFSKLTAGTNYKVKVTAYKTISGKKVYSLVSTTLATATKVATPTLKVTSKTKGTANLTWTNVAGENGYEVYYSTSKSSGFKSLASYKTNVAKGSKSKLTSKKTYYFKVRAFKTVNGKKVYGDWSKVVSVKVK